MKTQKIVALMSLLGSMNAYAQSAPAEEVKETADPVGFLSLADASKLILNFGVKEVSGTYMLTGTIPNECFAKLAITLSDSQKKDGVAGGWMIQNKGGAFKCVSDFKAAKKIWNADNCVSLSQGAQKLTIKDIDTKGMTREQLKDMSPLKIDLFRYDETQDIANIEGFIVADEIDSKVTFTSPAHLAELEKIKKEEDAAKEVADNQSAIDECLEKHQGYDEARSAIKKLYELGKLTEKQAKKDLEAVSAAEFEGDLEQSANIALVDRAELLKKLDKWALVRKKDADRIADARMKIAERVLSGKEVTEEDEMVGLSRADIVEAYAILNKAKTAKGLSKAKASAINEAVKGVDAADEQRVVAAAHSGQMTTADLSSLSKKYAAREAKVCSPQLLTYLKQQQQGYGQQGYGQQGNNGYGMSSQFGLRVSTGFNGGMSNPYQQYNPYQQQQYMPQNQNQNQNRNTQYNAQECQGLVQAEQNLVYMKMQSDQIKNNPQYALNGNQNYNPAAAGQFQQVSSNLFTTNPGAYQQNTGMWNNNSNAYNPNYNQYYNSQGQYNPYNQYRI